MARRGGDDTMMPLLLIGGVALWFWFKGTPAAGGGSGLSPTATYWYRVEDGTVKLADGPPSTATSTENWGTWTRATSAQLIAAGLVLA